MNKLKVMKTFFSLLSFSTICFLFSSCKKNNDEKFTLKGQIFQSCTSAPLANKKLSFFQGLSSNIVQVSGGDLGSTTTDANGSFTFQYTPHNDNDIKILTPAGAGFATIIQGVPGKENLDNIKIYYRPSTTVQVKLNVTKPYTANDTLYISDYRSSTFLKLNGPFTSGILYNAAQYGILNYYYRPTNYLETLVFKIGNNANWNQKEFQLIPCDTSRVTVDIN